MQKPGVLLESVLYEQIGVTVLANMDSVLGRDISYSIYDMVLDN
jgi:hypothetical protein